VTSRNEKNYELRIKMCPCRWFYFTLRVHAELSPLYTFMFTSIFLFNTHELISRLAADTKTQNTHFLMISNFIFFLNTYFPPKAYHFKVKFTVLMYWRENPTNHHMIQHNRIKF
jgi:hypothetical protein